MTSIAWSNGPIFRSGAIGAGQACCCNQCPCGMEKDGSGECVFCSFFDYKSADWEGISLPDENGNVVWSVGGGGDPVYTLALQTTSGAVVPAGGWEVVDGTCYFARYVGTIVTPVSSNDEGSCRATGIIWRALVPFTSCSDLVANSPHTAQVSFYSGYNQIWTGTEEQVVDIFAVGDACASSGTPVVTIEFVP